MPHPRTAPTSYLSRLLTELADLETTYMDIISRSDLINIDPARSSGPGFTFIGFAKAEWATSDVQLEAARMHALEKLRNWSSRFRLLFPHATPQVTRRLDIGIGRLERWLERGEPDKSLPSTTDAVRRKVTETIADLRALAELLPANPWAIRLVVDTNSLIDNPDLAAYVPQLGPKYMVHLLPVLLRELDDQKRAGRNQEVRDGARAAERRLKGLRDNGTNVAAGVRVQGDVHALFEHIEPRAEGLPSWLDLSVPDDRFVASTLRVQSRHPGSVVYAGTSDLNLQTKFAAIGLPFVEVPGAV